MVLELDIHFAATAWLAITFSVHSKHNPQILYWCIGQYRLIDQNKFDLNQQFYPISFWLSFVIFPMETQVAERIVSLLRF